MKTNRTLSMILILLIFSLIITSCSTSKRPEPENNRTPNQTGVSENANPSQPKVNHSAQVNDERTKDNIMPNQPDLATPNSNVGFTLDQINEFELDVKLTNGDKVDMKYVKGPSNKESKIETRLDGKTEKTEHEEASREIERLIKKIPGASLSNVSEIIDGTLSELKIKRSDVIEFDMDFKLESGEKVQLEFNKDKTR